LGSRQKTIVYWLDGSSGQDGLTRRAAIVETAEEERKELWFEITGPQIPPLSNMNAFLCATTMMSMARSRDLHIAGPVSKSLLYNLDAFQEAYATWIPSTYKRVTITADVECDDLRLPVGDAVMTMSGGVDAAFSYFRHTNRWNTSRPYNIKGVVLAQGLDTPLSDPTQFNFVRDCVERQIDGDDVPLYLVRTNLRRGEFVPNWTHSHGSGLASLLHQFDGVASTGLIAGDFRYDALTLPWGSSPVSNPLLSSGAMTVTYDGAGYGRTEKIAALSLQPKLVSNLSVCHKGPGGSHCGECEKCIRTVLNFRANKLPLPSFFPRDITDEQISGIPIANEVQRKFAIDILKRARRNGVDESWLKVLANRIAAIDRSVGAGLV
jgi:hypothetical protein